MRFIFLFAATVGLSLSALSFAGDPAPADKTGLPVGTKAPKFALQDQAGKERTLDEFLKDGTVALIFHRSAGW
ncbi:hypothetical protein BH09PLA1_BH09PLA1_17200 [soil metagenome]